MGQPVPLKKGSVGTAVGQPVPLKKGSVGTAVNQPRPLTMRGSCFGGALAMPRVRCAYPGYEYDQ